MDPGRNRGTYHYSTSDETDFVRRLGGWALKPLDQIEFGDQPDLFDEECNGVCGV